MKKGFLLFGLCISLCSAQAALRPVVSLAVGADVINLSMNQNVTLIPPYQNNYANSQRYTDFVGSLFIGFETLFTPNVLWQLGLSYYQNNGYLVQGVIDQFGDPLLNNFNYQYNIQSQRVFVESKLLTTFQERYHPYLTAGIGRARNRADGYTEIPLASSDVPMLPGFGGHTTYSFAYLIGLGMDMDLSAHLRLGAQYRFVNLGKARLSTTPLQNSNDTLSNNPLHTNEFLLQLSYLG